MWKTNDDGAGIAYYTEAGIQVIKGLMTTEALQAKLDRLADASIVFHVRNATAGKKNKFMCHPYIISPKLKEALKPHCIAQAVLFHNGIISGFGNKKISDTVDFVVNGLAHVKGLAARKTILRAMPGKYIIMQDNETWMMNGFKTVKLPEGDIECSHDRWNYTYTPATYNSYNKDLIYYDYKDDHGNTKENDDTNHYYEPEYKLITHDELLAAGYYVVGYDQCDECRNIDTLYAHLQDPFITQLCSDCLTYKHSWEEDYKETI